MAITYAWQSLMHEFVHEKSLRLRVKRKKVKDYAFAQVDLKSVKLFFSFILGQKLPKFLAEKFKLVFSLSFMFAQAIEKKACAKRSLFEVEFSVCF